MAANWTRLEQFVFEFLLRPRVVCGYISVFRITASAFHLIIDLISFLNQTQCIERRDIEKHSYSIERLYLNGSKISKHILPKIPSHTSHEYNSKRPIHYLRHQRSNPRNTSNTFPPKKFKNSQNEKCLPPNQTGT